MMKTLRDPDGRLIVTSVSNLVRMLLGLAVLGVAVAWIAPITVLQAAEWTVVCCVFGLALAAANQRSTFAFDRQSQSMHWRSDTPFRHESGDIPFAAITALSIERDFKSASPSRGRGGARRLVLLTTQGPIPFTMGFSGLGSDVEAAADAVRTYLSESIPGRAVPINQPSLLQ